MVRYVFIDPEKTMEENLEHSVKMEEIFKKLEKEEKEELDD